MKIPRDKKLHFFYGMFFSSLGFIWFPLVFLGFLAGIFKEVIDYFGYGTPDIWDMIWTWFGASVPLLFILL
jgi:hypothetical protein